MTTFLSCGKESILSHLTAGDRLQMLGSIEHAVEQYRHALRLDASCYEAWNGLGTVFASLRDWPTASTFFEQACRLNPHNASLHNNFANTLFEMGTFLQAVKHYEAAISIDTRNATFHNNYGNALHRSGQFVEAEQAFCEALRIRPDYPEAHANLGYLHYVQGRRDEAEAHFRSAMELNPNLPVAHVCLGQLLLARGEFNAGWAEYEWRWVWDGFTSPKRHFKQPQWSGQELLGKRILLHAEQGFGDTIHFARYVGLVAAKGGEIILEVHPELVALMTSLLGVAQLIARGQPLPSFDYHCPLMSLPLAFSTTRQTIPAAIPYLHAKAVTPSWVSANRSKYPKIGLVWAGSPSNTIDQRRSIPTSLVQPLLRLDAAFYSFQRSACDAVDLEFSGILPEYSDFVETAAAIARMDLLVSVDTAAAHLAGALGKPVWVLLPKVADWRWLLDQRDSPWYPTARLFRQQRSGDWVSVINEVAYELSRFITKCQA